MKDLVFSFLVCLIVLFMSFYPGIPGTKGSKIKTDKQWIDEILKEQGIERSLDKDYIFTKWESETRKGWYDFNLDIVDKEIKNE